jgi:hypothetical protein
MTHTQPPDLRRLDAQAIRVLRKIASQFAVFESRAKEKYEAETGGNPVTTMLAEAAGSACADCAVAADKPRQRADAFAAHLVWLSEAPLLPGRGYLLKASGQSATATVTELKYRLNVDGPEHLAAKQLRHDEIAFANVATAEPISFDSYEENSATGGFILIDRHNNATVAAGIIRFGLRRAANTYFQSFEVTKTARARLNNQRPALLWFTGLSGAGQSREKTARDRQAHLCARRRQYPPRAQSRFGLHSSRSRREHSPRGRGGEAFCGSRPHYNRCLHFSVSG